MQLKMQVKAHRLEELELFLTIGSMVFGFLAPRLSRPCFRFAMRRLRRLTRLPRLSLLLVGCLPLVLRFLLLPWIPVPQPQIQEEFSYLLGADTFAHGRLANPRHLMAFFFDNIQLIQTPHYASARPPGQTAFLWIGEAGFHLPWLGVCLSVGLMCAAFLWMLRAWTPPSWALLASILFAIRFGVFTYWINSYWGGAVIALGGALVLGAFPRILSKQRIEDAFLYGLGCCLLASTRPYEGLVYVLPTSILLAIWLAQSPDRAALRIRSVHVLLPISALIMALLAWFAYYNFRTTGNILETAYGLWRKQQGVVPAFWWQPLHRAPIYYSPQVRQFNAVWEVAIYRGLRRNLFALISAMAWRLMQFLQLYVRPLLFLPFLIGATGSESWRAKAAGRDAKRAALSNGLWVASGLLALLLGHALAVTVVFLTWGGFRLLRSPGGLRCFDQGSFDPAVGLGRRIPVLLLLAGGLCAILTTFSMPTYYAHFTAPAFVLIAMGMRSLAGLWRRQGIGRAIVANLSISCCLMFLVSTALSVFHIHVLHESPFNWSTYENGLKERAAVESFLNQQPGKQLAIVRYGPHHDVLKEWVWNLADIDGQKIVWARDSKPAWDAQLIKYYSGRSVWLLEPDAGSVRPYPLASLPPFGEPPPAMSYGEEHR